MSKDLMNKDEQVAPSRLRFRYEMAPESRLQAAHGVWGGINSQGEIEMNFYHESDALPACSEQVIAPDGSLGPEIIPGDGDVRDVTRHIHSRVLLNYHTARAVLEWLENRVSLLEEEGAGEIYPHDSGLEQ